MKQSTPKTELPTSTHLRKVVFGGALVCTALLLTLAIISLYVSACSVATAAENVAKSPAANQTGRQTYDIAAYYWPAYHDEPRWRPFFRGTEGEWEIIRNAKPKWPGHYQPRIPLWGYEDESDPKVMEKKIDAAASHSVNVFIFDWYWYDGQPFLEKCINDGFLKATNNDKIGFFLMWANHDMLTLWDLERSDKLETISPGTVDRKNFDVIVDRVIERYMKHPSYYKIDGKPVFSIYDLSNLIKGLGGIEQTKDALASFRRKVKAAGFPGLHTQAILWGQIPATQTPVAGDLKPTQSNTIEQLGIDSLTSYQWCHTVWPEGDYAQWAKSAMSKWEPSSKEFAVPYYPHVSIDWDTNPRYKAPGPGRIENRSPQTFTDCLRKAKEYVGQHHLKPGLITINSWNEWSEGSYLEPDKKFGMAYLDAVKQVFQPANRGQLLPNIEPANNENGKP